MTEATTAPEAFVNALQAALQDLYNPAALRKNPLLALVAADRHDPLAATRQVLTDAIRALKPASNVPLHADAWRVHHILTYRYVEQLAQKEVAAELALSVRQLRRLEHEAMQVLADYLWTRYNLAGKVDEWFATLPEVEAPAALSGDSGHMEVPDRAAELAWLRESLPEEMTDIKDVVASALKTIAPLAEVQGVQIAWDMGVSPSLVSGPRAALRQALLNLLAAAVNATPGGQVQVAVESDAQRTRVHVRAAAARRSLAVKAAASHPDGETVDKLQVTRQLCTLFGGALETRSGVGQPFVVALVLPVVAPVPVLVIDDHADALRLMERYLAGTRYAFYGIRDPEQAVALAQEIAPRAIVLDVMLPGIDGWELLGRLREHPCTRDVPVIACTILPQEQLALALGAAAFLRKPVSRETLLQVLDRQCGLGQ